MKLWYLLVNIALMAGVTYLIRVLPMAIFRKRIKNTFVQSFLAYVPYGVLSAMTFPSILYSTGSVASAGVGCVTAVVLAYLEKSLLTVAIGTSAAVLAAQMIGL